MVAFKWFSHADKGPQMGPDNQKVQANSALEIDNHPKVSSPECSESLDAEHHFQRIEKQFEMMHDQLQSRPLSSCTQAIPSRASTRRAERNPGHVDLLDALFSSHRYHIQTSSTLSPITPYNEDIAERNMTRFLRGQPRKKNIYTRLISALYQEDVADRNISKSRRRSRSLSRSISGRSQGSSCRGHQYDANFRPRPKAKESRIAGLASRIARSRIGHHASPTQTTTSRNRSSLRHQRSASSLLADEADGSQMAAGSNDGGYLGVPPAHKQGHTWSNTPLPDSPTLPTIMGDDDNQNQSHSSRPSSSSSFASYNRTPPISPRRSSKKNIRDLSINTELAARGSSTSKIVHRAIQPPTPSTESKQNPSIAEVMNSPLPDGTPTTISPMPITNQKVAEIMDMFRQAYKSTQAITPHPTFETLQDAIVREINSHEAFRRVLVPDVGPPFPPSSHDSFDQSVNMKSPGSGRNRSLSIKDGQLSRLIRRNSFKKHTRTGSADTRKSISTSAPSKASQLASDTNSRRRHTDAPPPSPGFFGTLGPQEQVGPEERAAYMDILRSQISSRDPSQKRYPDLSKDVDRPESFGTVSSYSMPENDSAAPSVYYMRAQTSASSDYSRSSFSTDDGDEEVIQLPSVGEPKLEELSFDDNTSPQQAYKLMDWPRKSGRSVSLQGNNNPFQASPPKQRHIRESRSVESY